MCGETPRAGPPRNSVRLPLREIRFDEDEDLLTMALGGVADRSPELRFFIEHPRRICAAESPEGESLVVTERRGADVRLLVPRRPEATSTPDQQRGPSVRGLDGELGSAAR